MINALWLILIVPAAASLGFVLAALISANGCEECRAKYKEALRTQYNELTKGGDK